MKGRRTLLVVTVLALLCLCGIVGMLLAESAWDWLFFAMAALPLAAGGARRVAARQMAK